MSTVLRSIIFNLLNCGVASSTTEDNEYEADTQESQPGIQRYPPTEVSPPAVASLISESPPKTPDLPTDKFKNSNLHNFRDQGKREPPEQAANDGADSPNASPSSSAATVDLALLPYISTQIPENQP